MTYTVKYRKVGSWFWHKVKNVWEDGYIETGKGVTLAMRVLYLEDKSRIEIPIFQHVFKFSKERFYAIEKTKAAKKTEAAAE